MRRKLILFIIQTLFVILVLVFSFVSIPNLRKIHTHVDNLIYDLMLYTVKPYSNLNTSEIVVIDIDDKSLQKEGRWPWQRDKLAILVENLRKYGVLSLAFDITFTHPDVNPAIDLMKKLQKLAPSDTALQSLTKSLPVLDNDALFAKVLLKKNDSVLGVIFEPIVKPSMGTLPKPLVTLPKEVADKTVIPNMKSYQSNIKILQDAAKNGGSVTIIPDSDGIMRRSPLLVRYQNDLYPSLALQAIKLYLLVDEITINWKKMGNLLAVDSLQLGSINIPTDPTGKVIIPYPGNPVIKFISATDVLSNTADPMSLKDKVAIIGTSALGLSDLHATPLQGVFAGVEIQAIIMSGLIYGFLPYRPFWAPAVELLITFLIGLGLIIVLPFLRALGIVFLSLITLLVLILVGVWLIKYHHVVLAISTPMFTVIGLAFINLFYDLLFEYKKRKQMMAAFSQYIPSSRINAIAEESGHASLEGESKELTVLFADIVNFTQMCEKLNATDIKELLNQFFTPMTKIIFEHQGTIDKYVGDLIMAFWGAPISDENHVKHALQTSLEMMNKKNELREKFLKAGLPEIDIGIGINTGNMHVGDMGSEYRLAYTVLGDAVNLASRIEKLTRIYKVDIAVSESSRLGEDDFIFRLLDKVRVRGKSQAVKIYELICYKKDASTALYEELLLHNKALDFYFDQTWDEAEKLFQQLHHDHPNTYIYEFYLKRIQKLKKGKLDKNWDGVWG